jgi:hypothetical protein
MMMRRLLKAVARPSLRRSPALPPAWPLLVSQFSTSKVEDPALQELLNQGEAKQRTVEPPLASMVTKTKQSQTLTPHTHDHNDSTHSHDHEHAHGHDHSHEHSHDHGHSHDHEHTSEAPEDDLDEWEEMFIEGPAGMEWNGPTRGGARPEPTRFGDWERKGRASDF